MRIRATRPIAVAVAVCDQDPPENIMKWRMNGPRDSAPAPVAGGVESTRSPRPSSACPSQTDKGWHRIRPICMSLSAPALGQGEEHIAKSEHMASKVYQQVKSSDIPNQLCHPPNSYPQRTPRLYSHRSSTLSFLPPTLYSLSPRSLPLPPPLTSNHPILNHPIKQNKTPPKTDHLPSPP